MTMNDAVYDEIEDYDYDDDGDGDTTRQGNVGGLHGWWKEKYEWGKKA